MIGNRRLILVILVFFIGLLPFCCKKAVKSVGEEIVETSAKKTGKQLLKRAAMSSEETLEMVMKKSPLLERGIMSLSKTAREDLGVELATDPRFYKTFSSSNTVLDEFEYFAKEAPEVAENIGFVKMFSNAKCFDTKRTFKDVILKDNGGKTQFLRKNDNVLLAEYSDGVVTLKNMVKNGTENVKNPLMKSELLPNTLYRITNDGGGRFFCKTDEFGRLLSLEARNCTPENLECGFIGNADFGPELERELMNIQRSFHGKKVDVNCLMKHSGDFLEPQKINLEASCGKKRLVSKTISNSNWDKITKSVERYAKKNNVDKEKTENLLAEIKNNPRLEALIYENPDFNIKRWLNTRNKVDKSSLARRANGKVVTNHSYAGNTFYFEPALNSNLDSYLKRKGGFKGYAEKELMELDRLFPNGVSFNKKGFPDFLNAGVCAKNNAGKDIVISMPMGKFSKNGRNADFAEAWELLRKEYGDDLARKFNNGEYTWHHLEEPPARMILVNTKVHELVSHTGGVAMGL